MRVGTKRGLEPITEGGFCEVLGCIKWRQFLNVWSLCGRKDGIFPVYS